MKNIIIASVCPPVKDHPTHKPFSKSPIDANTYSYNNGKSWTKCEKIIMNDYQSLITAVKIVKDQKVMITKLESEIIALEERNDQKFEDLKAENASLKLAVQKIQYQQQQLLNREEKCNKSMEESDNTCSVVPTIKSDSTIITENVSNNAKMNDTIEEVIHAIDSRNDIKVNFLNRNMIFFRFENVFHPDQAKAPGYRLNLALKSLYTSFDDDPIKKFEISKIRLYKRRYVSFHFKSNI